jgi:hypothetical protein
MKKSIVTVLGVSLLGAGLYASQAHASDPVPCDAYSTSWFGQTLTKGCFFSGVDGDFSWGIGAANTQSGEITPGTKGLLSDLYMTYNVPNTWYVYAAAIGYGSNGRAIAGCRADDTSTANGQSAVDGDGCQDGVKHRLYMRVTQ